MSVSVLGVVGAGFMGSGIAESVAMAGRHAVLYEPTEGPLEHARQRLASALEKSVSRGKLSKEDATAITDRILYTTKLEELSGADGVVEAITENAKLKGELFERLDQTLPDAHFIASNTSSIPIAELAARTQRPERVLGLHFFSPVPVMKLVEVVVALDTAPEVVDEAEAFATEIGKQPIETKDRSGFIVNMLLIPYLVAAVRMFEDGFATREDIDTGMKLGCGHPMGPLTLCDFIGLDVIYAVCNSLFEEFKRPEYAPPPLLSRMLASGRLGRKSGHGFYDYESAKAKAGAAA